MPVGPNFMHYAVCMDSQPQNDYCRIFSREIAPPFSKYVDLKMPIQQTRIYL